jgi:hypothetical protein
MAIKLMACKKRSRGKARSTASRPTGSSSAPPMPCTTRAATSCIRLAESAHAMEPMTKSEIAATYTRRVPKRSATQPDAGMSMAMVSE